MTKISIPTNVEREFTSIINEHSRIINKICYFYSSVELPFDDLRQEIYLSIWNGFQNFRGDCKLSTWVYRVSVNTALMAIRSSKKTIRTVQMDFSILNISTEMDNQQKDILQELYTLINRLEDIEKAIILLWLDDCPYEDIAETVGLNRNTVATKIRRIKDKLSKSL